MLKLLISCNNSARNTLLQPCHSSALRNVCYKTTQIKWKPTRRTMTTAISKRLEGKTIVITGASSGIGRSTAFEFARTAPTNLKLVLTARRVDVLKQIAEEIKKEVGDGVKVLTVKLDVSNQKEVKSFVEDLPAEFKDIDVLVNNA